LSDAVSFDLERTAKGGVEMGFVDPRELPEIQPKPGWHGHFFHSEQMTFSYYEIDAGASLHAHSHPNEEVWNVVTGELELTLGEETRRVGAGCALVVPAGTTHAAAAKKRCSVIVVDHPVRHEVGGVKI
jgi:quercetin dioxygenase-like cupin family protein